MTDPRTPGDAITRAADRIRAQRESARQLADELAAKRAQVENPDERPQETVNQ